MAKPKRVAARDKPKAKLTRVAFRVSRLMEYCSERELINQTGHAVYDWPLVVAKELFDNAADEAEEAEVAPEITVIVERDTIVVQDNGRGIDEETIASVLDYTIRVSSREASHAAHKATRSRPSSPWATCSIAGSAPPAMRRA